MKYIDAKPAIKSKTLWFNALAVVLQVAIAYGFGEHEPAPWTNETAIGIIAIANIILRFVTTQPLISK